MKALPIVLMALASGLVLLAVTLNHTPRSVPSMTTGVPPAAADTIDGAPHPVPDMTDYLNRIKLVQVGSQIKVVAP
jgi:hypothetical protein